MADRESIDLRVRGRAWSLYEGRRIPETDDATFAGVGHSVLCMIPDDERRLLQRVRREPGAFGEIFDAHYPGLFAYAFRRMGDFEVAQDVTAETFLKAYRTIGRFRWRGVPLAAWLFRIATNEINLHFRGKRCHSEAMARLAANAEHAASAKKAMDGDRERLVAELARHRQFLRLQTELQLLPTTLQDVLALRYFEGKSVREIAEILGRKEGSVKSLLSRGVDRLRKRCAETLEPRRETLEPEEHRR